MEQLGYIRVRWLHDTDYDPVELWSELDASRFESRKLEIFRDDRMTYASAAEATGDTGLGEVEVPPLAEIAAMPDFEPKEIAKEAFEELWERWHAGRFPAPQT